MTPTPDPIIDVDAGMEHYGTAWECVYAWPRETCQHHWCRDGIVLTVIPPIYPQTCSRCGATRKWQDGKAFDYHERNHHV